MTLGKLLAELGGTLANGAGERTITGVNSYSRASATDLLFAEDAASASVALNSNAGAVVLRPGLFAAYPAGKCVVEADQPRLWFARAAQILKPQITPTGVHPSAVVGDHADLGVNIIVGPGAVIDDHACVGDGSRIEAGAVIGQGVRIGRHCHIHPRAVLYAGVTLRDRVVVHAGAVLGADGFGYVRDSASGAYTQFPQQGTLVIEDDVEIGANSTIDRGALAETRIRRGVKIDNLVHIGHNCDIGEDVILVALTGISGSSSVGRGAVIAGQVGIGDHAHVGPGVILGGQAGVLSGKTVTNEGLKPGTVLWGTPARPLKQVLREIAVLGRLARGRSRGPQTPDSQG
ncbi:MAG TPA: UDP-3-O-(3-hydroxymyristoyl)glucosamine N-acyltransferase [Terracidiphilus sp.]|jgi:UDP-3-O-[3-hydroxymyristoyl] glucosamine N-acyltransferase